MRAAGSEYVLCRPIGAFVTATEKCANAVVDLFTFAQLDPPARVVLPCGLLLAVHVRMDIFTLLVVGLVAGLLASVLVRGSGLGILGDIAVGILGAIVGAWTFHELGWGSPFNGIAGTIVIAFVGSTIVLAGYRLVRHVTSE